MDIWNWITGSKRPAPGVKPVAAAELKVRLMAVNRPTAPFKVRSGAKEGVDLVAEWRIVDAKWYEVFAKAGLTRVFKVLMRIDEARHEVRAVDEAWEVEWRAGMPVLSAAAKASRGQSWEMSFETVYAFREDLSFGEVYTYSFSTREIKGPLKAAVLGAGWGWRGVAFGKL